MLVVISILFLCVGLFGFLLYALTPYGVTAEFKTVKPGVYDDTEKKVIEEIKKVLSGNKQELAEKIKARRQTARNIVWERSCRVIR